MALRIADTCPAPSLPRRLARGALVPLGGLLVLVGLVGLAPGLLSAAGALFELVFDTERSAGDEMWGVYLLTGIALLSLLLGVEMLRGRRRLVLFLRRFGFDDSSHALTHAVETALGRRWRVVTLDDARLAPVGVKRSVRWSLRWGRWLALLAVGAGLVLACFWALGPGPDTFVSGVFDQEVARSRAEGEPGLFGLASATCLAAIGVFSVLLIFLVMLLGLAIGGAGTLLAWASSRMAARADASRTDEIRTEGQVEAFSRRVTRRSRLLFAPRLVSVRVATPQWRRTVRVLAASAAAILIDLSEPTDNLLWEVETLDAEVATPWVLVGRRDRLEALARGGEGEIGEKLARHLDGAEALAYQEDDRRSRKRFAVALRNRLDRVTC